MKQKLFLLALPLYLLFNIPVNVIGQNVVLKIGQNGRIEKIESGFLKQSGNITLEIKDSRTDTIYREIKSRVTFVDTLLANMPTGREMELRDRLLVIRDELSEKKLNALGSKGQKELLDFLIKIEPSCESLLKRQNEKLNVVIDELFFKNDRLIKSDSLPGRNGKTKFSLSADCFSSLCLTMYTIRLIKEIIEIKSELYAINQKGILIKELFCNTVFRDSIRIDTTNKDILKIIDSSYSNVLPASILMQPEYKAGNSLMTYNKADGFYSGKYPLTDGKNEIVVTRTDVFKEQLIKWHNQNNQYIDSQNIRLLSGSINRNKTLFDSLYKKIKCSEGEQTTFTMFRFYHKLLAYDTVWCEESGIFKWLRNWAWFSGGDFSLNYLPVANLSIKEQQIKSKIQPGDVVSKTEDENIKELLERIDTLKKCLKCSIATLDTLEQLQKKAELLLKRQKANSTLEQALIKIRDSNAIFRTTTTKLHSISLPPCCGTKWIQFHDASNNYLLCQQKSPVIPDDIPVYFGVYNATTPQDENLKFKQTKSEFKDKGFFVQEVSSALSELENAIGLLGPGYSKVNAFLGNVIGSFSKSSDGIDPGGFSISGAMPVTHIPESVILQFNNRASNDLRDKDELSDAFLRSYLASLQQAFPNVNIADLLLQSIQRKYWRWLLLEDMINKYYGNPTPGNIETVKDNTIKYYTYTEKAAAWDAPFTNKYEVTYKDKEVSANRYSVGSQKRIAIGAGVFINAKSARQVYVDSSSGNINITNADTRSKFVVGLKYFPWKSFMADDGFIPKYPLKRVSIFTGFELTKPLDNLYAGIGYDLLPGLHLSGGIHFFKQDVFKVVNNQVTDKTTLYKSSGLYYGVTLDPTVLAGLIKVFFK